MAESAAKPDTQNLIGQLSEQEIAEIRAEASHYEYPQAASVEALKIVQKHRGWVSDQSLREVARLLDMSAEQLDGVATFYSLIFRRPVGDNILMLCEGITCWMLGCEELRATLRQRLGIDYGETTADKRFTLIPVTCQGACDRAPVLLNNMRLHTHLTAEKLERWLSGEAQDDKDEELHEKPSKGEQRREKTSEEQQREKSSADDQQEGDR